MKLSFSIIGWTDGRNQAFAEALQKRDYHYIDVAPSKIWPAWQFDAAAVAEYRAWLKRFALVPWGMQSLFFGTQGLNLFASENDWNACRNHLLLLGELAEWLGVQRLVYGSPGNRNPDELTEHDAIDVASTRLTEVCDQYEAQGVTLCIEATPAAVGGKFLQSTRAAAEFILQVNHTALALNLDSAILSQELEDPCQFVREFAPIIKHVHASQPALGDFACPLSIHESIAATLRQIHYDGVVAIEMLPQQNNEYAEFDRALAFVGQCYGDH